jgi:peptide/nickel transport system ATP-binding protein
VSALDVSIQAQIINLLLDLQEDRGLAYMFVTHDLSVVKYISDDIMVMYAGQIVEKGAAREMVFDPVHPYSKGLMGSMLIAEEGMRDAKLAAIPGTPPNLKENLEGCRFAPRCPYAAAQCRAINVRLEDIGPGRCMRCILPASELRDIYKKEAGADEK